MEFGSQTGFAAALGSLGLNSELSMLDSAVGVVEGIDALSRSAASLHHMTVSDGVGVDVTPDGYEELIRANMARPFAQLAGSLSLQEPLRSGYAIPRKELLLRRQSSPGVILTTILRNKRLWCEIIPDENAAYYEEFTLENFAWRPVDSREPKTDLVNCTAGPLTNNNGSSMSLYLEGSKCIITLFTADDEWIHVTTWKEDGTVTDRSFLLPPLSQEIGFGTRVNLNDHHLLPRLDFGMVKIAREGILSGSYRKNGSWAANVAFSSCAWEFFTTPPLPSAQASLDKSLIAGLISCRMALDAAN